MASEGEVGLKDVSSTTFGYLVAFLLPGLVGLYGLGFWSTEVSGFLLKPAQDSQATVGPSVLVLLAGLVTGLLVNALRAPLFEDLICKDVSYEPHFFQKIGAADRITTFRVFVDELFRYHQFYGGILIALIPMFSGWAWNNRRVYAPQTIGVVTLVFLLLEWTLFYNAKANYARFVNRVNELARGYASKAKAAGA
jgi:hypothetical protein